MSRYISLAALLAILVVIGLLTYEVLAGFMLPLILAVILAVIFDPVHRWISERMPKYPRLAAGLATLAVILSVLAPAALIVGFAASEIPDIVSRLRGANIENQLATVRGKFGLEMPNADQHRKIGDLLQRLHEHVRAGGDFEQRKEIIAALTAQLKELDVDAGIDPQSEAGNRLAELLETLAQLNEPALGISARETLADESVALYQSMEFAMLGGPVRTTLKKLANPAENEFRGWLLQGISAVRSRVVSATGHTTAVAAKFLIMTAIMLVAIYFFFSDGRSMIAAASRISPLEKRYERELLLEFTRTSRAIVLATLLSAVVQGVLAGFGYWIAGAEGVFLLTLMSIVMAMVPFLGAAAVWVPVSLWLMIRGDVGWGIFLMIYGAGVVSLADNFVRPYVLQGRTNLHPLLALLSVLGGAQALGPVGIFVGPMVVVFLQTLLNIVHRELLALSSREATGAT